MKCPVCTGVDLMLSERQGIEIDYCPQCRGVWLDRGELDKIIERSDSQQTATYIQSQPQLQQQVQHQQAYGKQHQESYEYGHDGHYKKKKSWITELFD